MGILWAAMISACLMLVVSSTSTSLYLQSKVSNSVDSRLSRRVIVKLRDAKSVQKIRGSSATLELQSFNLAASGKMLLLK